VGEPVLLADDSKRGPDYDQATYDSLRAGAEWSDGVCDCLESANAAVCACCCPCWLLYEALDRTGRIPTPIGIMSKNKYLIGFTALLLFNIFVAHHIPPVVHCRSIPEAFRSAKQPVQQQPGMIPADESGIRMQGTPAATLTPAQPPPPAAPPWAPSPARTLRGGSSLEQTEAPRALQDYYSGQPQQTAPLQPGYQKQSLSSTQENQHCTTAAEVICQLATWILTFLVVRGVRDKMNVRESDSVTCVKSVCCPSLCLCLQCCYLAQVSRHVSRAMGYDRPWLDHGGSRTAGGEEGQQLNQME